MRHPVSLTPFLTFCLYTILCHHSLTSHLFLYVASSCYLLLSVSSSLLSIQHLLSVGPPCIMLHTQCNHMKTTCWLVKMNILLFIEPIRYGVRQNSLMVKLCDATFSKPLLAKAVNISWYMMRSRGISRKSSTWHFQFSIWLKS